MNVVYEVLQDNEENLHIFRNGRYFLSPRNYEDSHNIISLLSHKQLKNSFLRSNPSW
jgi:hypothetical protein